MHKSVWEDSAVLPEYAPLKGDMKTDILIIGGGLCGLLCAYFLKNRGIDCTVVEANRIGSGVSSGTTAKITALHGLIYSDLANKYGFETAQKYYTANTQALQDFAKIGKSGCDWETKTAYTYSLQDEGKIAAEYAVLQKLGAQVTAKHQVPLPFSVKAAVGLEHQGQFHPLKWIPHILPGLKIYEHTRITEFTKDAVLYDGGKIKAKKIIVATHFPFLNKHGMYFLKLYQHRSYVLALENGPELDGMYVDEADAGLSFRNQKGLLLLGGGGGRTGKKCGSWDELYRFQKKHYPHSKAICAWATQDCMSLDKIPLIGQYSPNTPNLYVATGFNKWGMTSSMVAARILADKICGRENDCADIFAPDRSIWKPQLFVNGFETLTNFLYPTTRRCPHLGCALKWNKFEHSWDCSCHGSRFGADGKLLNNPANKDKKTPW